MKEHSLGPNTIAVRSHAGDNRTHRPLGVPVVLSAAFQFESSRAMGERLEAAPDEGFYTRIGHPTIAAAESKLAEIEGAERALLFSSGMAAISTALLTVLRTGDHVVAHRGIFAQTRVLLEQMRDAHGVRTTWVDATRPEAVAEAFEPDTRLVYLDSPTNPDLEVLDLRTISDLAATRGIDVFVDATVASPVVQRTLDLGATLVLHSGSKYLGGHSDLLCGVAAGSAELISRLRKMRSMLGPVLDPHAAFLLLRGLRTLGLRVERQCESALKIARFLEAQEGVVSVHYPWLESSPHAALARSQMSAGGGLVSFELDGGLEEAREFVDSLDLIPVATSLGGVETVIELPVELHFSENELGGVDCPPAVENGLIRLAVGIEDTKDLIGDLDRALVAFRRRSAAAPAGSAS